jgi:hypothetical protein
LRFGQAPSGCDGLRPCGLTRVAIADFATTATVIATTVGAATAVGTTTAVRPALSPELAVASTPPTAAPPPPLAHRLTVGSKHRSLVAVAGAAIAGATRRLEEAHGLTTLAAMARASVTGFTAELRVRSGSGWHRRAVTTPAPPPPAPPPLATLSAVRALLRLPAIAGRSTGTARATEVVATTAGATVEATLLTAEVTAAAAVAAARTAIPATTTALLAATATASDPRVVGICRCDRRCGDPHRSAHVFDHRAATTTGATRLGVAQW